MLRGEYDRMFRHEERNWWFCARRELVAWLLSTHAPGARRLLDVGCGTGILLASLDGMSRQGIGVDFSPHGLRYSRSRGLLRLAAGSGEALPIRDESVDAFVSLDSFEHMPNDERAMRECVRVLRPGGVGVVCVPALMLLWSDHDEALMHYRRYGPRDLRTKLEAAGLRIRSESFAVSFLFPGVLLVRLLSRLRAKRKIAATIIDTPPPANALLLWLMRLENRLLRRVSFPFGVSLVFVVERPAAQRERI